MNEKKNIKALSFFLLLMGGVLLCYEKATAQILLDYQSSRSSVAHASPGALFPKLEEDKVDPSMEIFPLLIPIICSILGESNAEEKKMNAEVVLEIQQAHLKVSELAKEMGEVYRKLIPTLKISDGLKANLLKDTKIFLEQLDRLPVGILKKFFGLPEKLSDLDIITAPEISDRLKTTLLEDSRSLFFDFAFPNTSALILGFGLEKERVNLERDYNDNKKILEEYREVLKNLNIEKILQLQKVIGENLKEINDLKEKLPEEKKNKRGPSLNIEKEVQKQLIGANVTVDGSNVKVAIIDSYFDPHQHTSGHLSEITLKNYEGKDKAELAAKAEKFGLKHANYTAGILHSIASGVELRMIDLRNEASLQDKEIGNMRVIAAIDEAIKSKVDFINISLRLSPDSEEKKNDSISEEMKKALLRAKEAGIGIIKSIGNDNELIGQTAYTSSLAQLVEEMNGSMVLVAATQYDEDWQLEKMARYIGKGTIGASNYAGAASHYTITAPGKNIYVGLAEEGSITSGTSMATPLTTAAASLVKSAHPHLSSRDVLRYLLQSARKYSYNSVGEPFAYLPAGKYGQGIVNVTNTLQLIESQRR